MSNGEDPAQSGENAEETNPDDNANPLIEPWMDYPSFFEEAYFPPEPSPSASESDQNQQDSNDSQAQQDQDTSPPAQPSMEGFENSQFQQAENNAESTNSLSLENVQDQQTQNPPGNIDQGETFPIPLFIGQKDPKAQKEWILPSKTPSKDLFDLDARVRIQIQRGQNSPNNSNPGETHPIPSIIGIDLGRSNGPYDPHQEPLYTTLHTRLSRTEAKDLRVQIRTRGLDVFSEPQWEPIMHKRGAGWQLKSHVGRKGEIFTNIRRSNRRGINAAMRQDDFRNSKRLSMTVERDGGEVLVEGIICGKPPQRILTPTSILLEIFEGFQV